MVNPAAQIVGGFLDYLTFIGIFSKSVSTGRVFASRS